MPGGPSAGPPQQRVVLVTGGGGPKIGRGISTALAQQGYLVVVADRRGDAADAVARELIEAGHQAAAAVIDVADPVSVAAGIAEVLNRFGTVDALVNSAGIGLQALAGDVTIDEFDRLFAINVRGPWLCTRAVLPSMLNHGSGSIVNIGSVHAAGGEEHNSLYSASKAAAAALARGIARDYGHLRIRCNTVHPGAVADPRSTAASADGAPARFLIERQMTPDPIDPQHIGKAVAFLLSDAAASITGTELFVDAGTSAMLFDRRPPAG